MDIRWASILVGLLPPKLPDQPHEKLRRETKFPKKDRGSVLGFVLMAGPHPSCRFKLREDMCG